MSQLPPFCVATLQERYTDGLLRRLRIASVTTTWKQHPLSSEEKHPARLESLQEFATCISHMVHHDHIELPEHLFSKESTNAFDDGIREGDKR
jgi:hypothetical protein